jgi:hypothetical protein
VLKDPEEIQVGRIVHLYPQTKQASQNVHKQLAVSVMKDPRAHWPMVVVGWKEDGVDKWELVHRDNIRLKRASSITTREEKRAGDTTGNSGEGGMAKWARKRAIMPGTPPPPIEGQMELF